MSHTKHGCDRWAAAEAGAIGVQVASKRSNLATCICILCITTPWDGNTCTNHCMSSHHCSVWIQIYSHTGMSHLCWCRFAHSRHCCRRTHWYLLKGTTAFTKHSSSSSPLSLYFLFPSLVHPPKHPITVPYHHSLVHCLQAGIHFHSNTWRSLQCWYKSGHTLHC